MKVLILCGGLGVLDPETRNRIPKCMLRIGNKPLIWHIMKLFSSYGHTDFVLALGQGGDLIKNYFINAVQMLHDVEVSISDSSIKVLNIIPEENWKIKLVNTGVSARTGARIARCSRFLSDGDFLISYSDLLSDVQISEVINSHVKSKSVLTLTGVRPPSRFGSFTISNDKVVDYHPNVNLKIESSLINGGFMVASSDLLQMISPVNECNLETEIFEKLVHQGQLNIFKHEGFWQNVDTERDLNYLQSLYDVNKRPWLGIN